VRLDAGHAGSRDLASGRLGPPSVSAWLSGRSSGKYGWSELAGITVLLAAASVAEAFPVPIEGVAVGATSLATIFLVAIAAIYGWPAAAVAGLLAMAFVEVARRRPISRIAFNCGVYVIAGIAAGTAAATIHGGTLFHLVVGTIAAAISFYLVDITLLAAVVSRSRQLRFLSSLRNYVYLTLMPFAIMASLTVVLVVLWDRSPYVAVVLAAATRDRHLSALDSWRFERLRELTAQGPVHRDRLTRAPDTADVGLRRGADAPQPRAGRHSPQSVARHRVDRVCTAGSALDDVLWVTRLTQADRAVHHSCGAARSCQTSMRPELTYRPGCRSISALTPPPFRSPQIRTGCVRSS
jgi:hypothetical protein